MSTGSFSSSGLGVPADGLDKSTDFSVAIRGNADNGHGVSGGGWSRC